jgi:hypothetical protein
LTQSYETLSALVHAPSKTGKSTLGATAPLPICTFDVEGSWRFIKTAGYKSDTVLRKTYWDPTQGPPPRYDGTWEVCIVPVQTWATLTQGYMWLSQAPHDFRSLIVDSVTEAQRKLKNNLRGLEQMRIQDWGDLLVQMDKLIRDFRDLVHNPNSSLRFVMFVAETEMKDGKWRPAMQGQIGRAMPYWVDLVGYLFAEQEPDPTDPNGQATQKVLKLLVGQHPQYEAGERVQGALGDVVRDPNITRMMTTIFGELESAPTPNPTQEVTK